MHIQNGLSYVPKKILTWMLRALGGGGGAHVKILTGMLVLFFRV